MNDTHTRAYEHYVENKNEIIRRVGMRIAWLLKRNDLTQSDLGISKTTVSNIIHFKCHAQIDNYIMIAGRLHVSLGDLMQYNDVGLFDCAAYDRFKLENADKFQCYQGSTE